MANNRYFVISATDPNLSTILSYTVESSLRRFRADGNKGIVKLASGDTNNYPELSIYLEYTHQQIRVFLMPEEWTLNILTLP
jgi:hypothetical protein